MYLRDPLTDEFGRTERPSVVTWPTMGMYPVGKVVGWLCGLRWGYSWLTLGNLLALVTIPFTLCMYFWKVMPFVTRRYQLTDMRVMIQNGWSAQTGPNVRYDEFDRVVTVVYPGQKFYRSADLFFYQGDKLVLVLESVRFPQTFVSQVMETKRAYEQFRAAYRNGKAA